MFSFSASSPLPLILLMVVLLGLLTWEIGVNHPAHSRSEDAPDSVFSNTLLVGLVLLSIVALVLYLGYIFC